MCVEWMPEEKLEVEKLEKWAENFKAVSHPMRLAVVIMLYGSDLLSDQDARARKSSLQSLTFTQILAVLGLPKSKRVANNLNYHLDKLIDCGFIKREPLQQEPGKTRVQTIYHISPKGQEFLKDFKLTEVIATSLKKPIL